MSNSSKTNATGPLFIFTVGTFLLAIFIFTHEIYYGQPMFPSDKLGQFGDFYGGVIATIASIFAGVYLYYTYLNSKKDSDFQIINKMFDNIVEQINNIQFRALYDSNWQELPKEKQNLFTGVDAIYNFDALLHTNPNSVLNQLASILDSFENAIFMAKNIRYKYDDMKEMTLKRIYFLYYSHILWPVWELEHPNEKRPNAVKGHLTDLISKHDDSKFIFDKYAKLSIDAINYLSKRKLVEKKADRIAELEKLKIKTDTNKN